MIEGLSIVYESFVQALCETRAEPPEGATRPELGDNRAMTDELSLTSWWAGLTPEQRIRAAAIASRPAPRGMAIDDLTATMLIAGLSTSRQIWTGQPEHLVEMLDDVADFVTRTGGPTDDPAT